MIVQYFQIQTALKNKKYHRDDKTKLCFILFVQFFRSTLSNVFVVPIFETFRQQKADMCDYASNLQTGTQRALAYLIGQRNSQRPASQHAQNRTILTLSNTVKMCRE